jgi:CheY-like chemotaxis protein
MYKAEPTGPWSSGMDVLLIEDNAADVQLAQEAFRCSKKQINLHVVGDGVEAMAFLQRAGVYVHAPRPHLILLDLNLPKMNGRQVLANIKNDIDLKTIPTMILTISDASVDIQYCYEQSANCYVGKPNDLDAYRRVVAGIDIFWFTLVKLPGDLPAQQQQQP